MRKLQKNHRKIKPYITTGKYLLQKTKKIDKK